MLAGVFALATAARAQTLEGFQWVDLRTDAQTVAAVTKALAGERYTALREVGFVGAPPPEVPAGTATGPATIGEPGAQTSVTAAPENASPAQAATVPPGAHLLVITATRLNPSALPQDDTLTIYDVDETSGAATMLIRGPDLHLAGWLRLRREGDPELAATYTDCVQCAKTTFFTSIYLDAQTKQWRARWPRSRAGAPIYSEGQEANGGQQVYALLDDEAGRALLGTWQHFAGRKRRESDFVYAYRVDELTGQDVIQPLAGSEARALETRLCKAQGEVLGIGGGQGSAACKARLGTAAHAGGTPARKAR